ncbi:MAG: hypothetical protein ACK43K_06530, partial [Chitinophagales bacterium]
VKIKELEENAEIKIEFYDLNGRLVLSKNINYVTNSQSIITEYIDIKSLNKRIYIPKIIKNKCNILRISSSRWRHV